MLSEEAKNSLQLIVDAANQGRLAALEVTDEDGNAHAVLVVTVDKEDDDDDIEMYPLATIIEDIGGYMKKYKPPGEVEVQDGTIDN